jgi:hypothetical protein
MKALHILRLLAVSAIIGAGSHSAQALTINWGSAYFDQLYSSNGSALDSSYTFQLGTFAGGFNPATNPLSTWQTNWRAFDSATAANGGWTPGISTVIAAEELLSTGLSGNTALAGTYNFSGQQAFVFVSNAAGTERALITNGLGDGDASDDWIFTTGADQTSFDLTWTFPAATQVIYGGLNGFQGPGGFTATPPNTPGNANGWTLQTHTTVPEPSSALLVSLLGLIATVRRRR